MQNYPPAKSRQFKNALKSKEEGEEGADLIHHVHLLQGPPTELEGTLAVKRGISTKLGMGVLSCSNLCQVITLYKLKI